MTIASAHTGIKDKVIKRIEESYPGLYDLFEKDGFYIDFREINPANNLLSTFEISSALTAHSVNNYAYKIRGLGQGIARDVAISGDGALTDASRALYPGVGLLVHEGFFVETHSKNHASIKEVVDYAISKGVRDVAIVHVNQDERKKVREIERIVGEALEKDVHVIFPSDHEVFRF